jgi:hypothetical protein
MTVTIIMTRIRSFMMKKIATIMLPVMATTHHGVVAACVGHGDCPIDHFCSTSGDCEDCFLCMDYDEWAPLNEDPNILLVAVPPIDNGQCPLKCRCSSHEECSEILSEFEGSSFPGGAFCAFYHHILGESHDWSACHTCQLLQDFGVFQPADNSDGSSDDGRSSSCPPNTPCLCATSSDCPQDSYCASDLGLYEEYQGPRMAPIQTYDGVDEADPPPCRGFCVSCVLGCVDDLILNEVGTSLDGAGGTRPQACYDVCPYHTQCNYTHADCQQDLDDDSVSIPTSTVFNDSSSRIENETYWCSANHQCKVCSLGCTNALPGWKVHDRFGSVDGACPTGCCGWGVTREPYWITNDTGVIAPCGATPETEIIPMYVTKTSNALTVEYFLAHGGEGCSTMEWEYLEWAAVDEDDESFVSSANEKTVIHKAVSVDCSQLQYLPCSEYPIWVAILMKLNSSSDYSFIYEPAFLNNGDDGYHCSGDSWPTPPPTATSTQPSYAILSPEKCIGIFVAGVIGIILIRMGVLDKGSNQRQDQHLNGIGSDTIPAAIPVTSFDFIAPPPPKEEPRHNDPVAVARLERPPNGPEEGQILPPSNVPEGPPQPPLSSKLSSRSIQVDGYEEV